MVTPSVVGVGQNLNAVRVVDCNDITLQVLIEVEGIEGVGGIRGRSVLHADGRARFVIQVDQEVTVPLLADDLGAVQGLPSSPPPSHPRRAKSSVGGGVGNKTNLIKKTLQLIIQMTGKNTHGTLWPVPYYIWQFARHLTNML